MTSHAAIRTGVSSHTGHDSRGDAQLTDQVLICQRITIADAVVLHTTGVGDQRSEGSMRKVIQVLIQDFIVIDRQVDELVMDLQRDLGVGLGGVDVLKELINSRVEGLDIGLEILIRLVHLQIDDIMSVGWLADESGHMLPPDAIFAKIKATVDTCLQ